MRPLISIRSFVLLFFVLVSSRQQDVDFIDFTVEKIAKIAPTVPAFVEFVKNGGCPYESQTYIYNINLFVDKQSASRIKDYVEANPERYGSISDSLGYLQVFVFFAESLNRLNSIVLGIGIQFRLNFDREHFNELSADDTVDPTCITPNEIKRRTETELNNLYERNAYGIGLNVYIFMCYQEAGDDALRNAVPVFFQSQKCGRVVGYKWRGVSETRKMFEDLVINLIINKVGNSVSGDKSFGAMKMGSLGIEEFIVSNVVSMCKFCSDCVSEIKGSVGELTESRYLLVNKFEDEKI